MMKTTGFDHEPPRKKGDLILPQDSNDAMDEIDRIGAVKAAEFTTSGEGPAEAGGGSGTSAGAQGGIPGQGAGRWTDMQNGSGIYYGSGNVTIGTPNRGSVFQVLSRSQDADGSSLIIGPTAASNLRLGYHDDYSWIQSHGNKPLAINPLENNVGIGTETPSESLEVKGTVKATKFIGDGSGLTGVLAEGPAGLATGKWADAEEGGVYYDGGNVGIGMDTPAEKLEVNGTVKADKFIGDGSGLTGLQGGNNEKWEDSKEGSDIYYSAGDVTVGQPNRGSVLQILTKNQDANGGSLIIGPSAASNLRLGYHSDYSWIQSHGNKPLAINPLGGNLGIGTKTPSESLEVNGTVKATKFIGDGSGLTGIKGGAGKGSDFSKGIAVTGNRNNHLEKDGAFYRYKGQAYITVNDNLFIRDRGADIKMHFDTNSGTFKTLKLRLGDKWLLSGIGDGHANDDWLRVFNVDGSDYYGGLAAGRLWTKEGSIAGSDLRMKKRVKDLAGSLKKVLSLRGVRFKWLDKKMSPGNQLGLIAQEVEALFPETVVDGPDGMKGINYVALIAPLVEAIKEQQRQIEKFQADIKMLKLRTVAS
ncbi:MAG: tail fiber domain-containing protein [Deltaproteobacteria bacterium]|nr:tail fiber domain-containing protein [Deltaproteobacteria bacterium]